MTDDPEITRCPDCGGSWYRLVDMDDDGLTEALVCLGDDGTIVAWTGQPVCRDCTEVGK